MCYLFYLDVWNFCRVILKIVFKFLFASQPTVFQRRKIDFRRLNDDCISKKSINSLLFMPNRYFAASHTPVRPGSVNFINLGWCNFLLFISFHAFFQKLMLNLRISTGTPMQFNNVYALDQGFKIFLLSTLNHDYIDK